MRTDSKEIQRRQLLKVLPAAGVGMLAGCSAIDGNTTNDDMPTASEGELGERVEPIILRFLSDQGSATEIYEGAARNMADQMKEHLGLEVTLEGVTTANHFSEAYNDARTYHFDNWFQAPRIPRLDPYDLMSNWTIEKAGANGLPNPPQFANCKYSTLVKRLGETVAEKKRSKLINKAQSIWSDEIGLIPYSPVALYGAVRTDMFNPVRTGRIGYSTVNPWYKRKSSNVNDGKFHISTTNPALSTTNYGTITDYRGAAIWSRQIHSPLTEYNENLEIVNVLANSIEISHDNKRLTVELVDNAVFHDEKPITAEDVQWTFQFIADNPSVWQQASIPPWESINIVDDRTVEFNLKAPTPSVTSTHFPRWGILHSQRWIDGGAPDNPTNFELDPIVGSGPFQVKNFRKQQLLEVSPFSPHPIGDIPNEGIIWQAFADPQSQFQSFKTGEIHAIEEIQVGLYNRILNEMSDITDAKRGKGWTTFQFWPQHSYGPTKFRAFRDASGKILDRRKIREVLFEGKSSAMFYCTNMPEGHPQRPPNEMLYQFTDKPTGDPEAARQTLTDNGWGWDDDGRLHYPADADLDPLWPKGSIPQPEQFPCINAKGEYVPPDQR